MALTVTIQKRVNLGDSNGTIFKGVASTSGTNALTAAAVGLARFNGVVFTGGTPVGTFSGATDSTTGNIQLYDGAGNATSGTFYALAFGT
jgi:hypothetical protein